MKTITINIESTEFSRVENWEVITNSKIKLDDILNYINTWLEKGYEEKIDKLNKIINSDFIIENFLGSTKYYKKDTKDWIDAVFWSKDRKIEKLEKEIKRLETWNMILFYLSIISFGIIWYTYFYVV